MAKIDIKKLEGELETLNEELQAVQKEIRFCESSYIYNTQKYQEEIAKWNKDPVSADQDHYWTDELADATLEQKRDFSVGVYQKIRQEDKANKFKAEKRRHQLQIEIQAKQQELENAKKLKAENSMPTKIKRGVQKFFSQGLTMVRAYTSKREKEHQELRALRSVRFRSSDNGPLRDHVLDVLLERKTPWNDKSPLPAGSTPHKETLIEGEIREGLKQTIDKYAITYSENYAHYDKYTHTADIDLKKTFNIMTASEDGKITRQTITNVTVFLGEDGQPDFNNPKNAHLLEPERFEQLCDIVEQYPLCFKSIPTIVFARSKEQRDTLALSFENGVNTRISQQNFGSRDQASFESKAKYMFNEKKIFVKAMVKSLQQSQKNPYEFES